MNVTYMSRSPNVASHFSEHTSPAVFFGNGTQTWTFDKLSRAAKRIFAVNPGLVNHNQST